MKAQTLRKVRLFHNYIAVFFAPGILFFAFTGWLQVAGFADRHGGVAPPAWIATIANLHKHQTVARPHRGGGAGGGEHRHDDAPPAGAPGAAATPGGDHAEAAEAFVPEKAFVVFLALALFVTTALGLVIALATPSTRRISVILIAAGIVVPVVLMAV